MVEFIAQDCLEVLSHSGAQYYSLAKAGELLGDDRLAELPVTLKVLAENLLRHLDGRTVTVADLQALLAWLQERRSKHEIAYHPARVLLQDFTGVPAVVDLAALRDAMVAMGGDADQINPQIPVDLVIDHSVQVDKFGTDTAFADNVQIEMARNRERYQFLKWGQQAFNHFRVVPPGMGICHQVNLEHLAKVVWSTEVDGQAIVYPDTLVGTDSHTTMINGLGVLGWGVGGIEAEAAMLGQPVSMLIPEVVGFCLEGELREGVTATDLVLTIVEMLRQLGVVGKFVEFYGPGLTTLPLAERATIANMTPEFGATCGFFPVDEETLNYLRLTGREAEQVALVEEYAKAQGLWHQPVRDPVVFSQHLQLDLSTVEASLAGPKRPQDRVVLSQIKAATQQAIRDAGQSPEQAVTVAGQSYQLQHGDVAIAAITSCTNTSNPAVLIGAGLLAKQALAKGLQVKPWVKTSLAPGSKVVVNYLRELDLLPALEALGFHVVGFGCTTCIGNSGPLAPEIEQAAKQHELVLSGVLSGNRNFEGRIHAHVQANWLASPPLVVAFALAGTTQIDLQHEPLGEDSEGSPVFLRDIWPSDQQIQQALQVLNAEMFNREYAQVFSGDADWQALPVPTSSTYDWPAGSTYVQHPSFFASLPAEPADLQDIAAARVLVKVGDSVTTDHISPAGAIMPDSPAGEYLQSQGVSVTEFNSYGARRGNHQVMMRGTFANIRLQNELTPALRGGVTRYWPDGEQVSIYQAAMQYQQAGVPLVVVAGKEYGTGSSRDWAAKGTLLLGVKAVIAESFERIHRANLIGMGVLPLQFAAGVTRDTLGLSGEEVISIAGVANMTEPGASVQVTFQADGAEPVVAEVICRIDTPNELAYYRHGGILQYVLRGKSRA